MNSNNLFAANACMKKVFSVFFLLISIGSFAQKAYRHTPVLQKGWYISLNPHSFLEPEHGAVGLGIGCRISKRVELWTELNYLYRGFAWEGDGPRRLQGVRNITSLKYYYNNKHGFFVGAEFRVKNYSFTDENTFINKQTNDTLSGLQYTAAHTLIGGGIFWGKRFKLTANGKFELEGNLGIGVKQRIIKRKGTPEGYSVIEYFNVHRINPVPDNDIEQALPYFPAIVRFIYHL